MLKTQERNVVFSLNINLCQNNKLKIIQGADVLPFSLREQEKIFGNQQLRRFELKRIQNAND